MFWCVCLEDTLKQCNRHYENINVSTDSVDTLSLGNIPSVADGPVTRRACLPTLDCNTINYEITLKNCGQFTAYYLKRPDSCDQAYCFGR